MTLRELFNRDRVLMQDMSPKDKLMHLWHYYKWYFAVFLLLLIYIGSTISAYIATSSCTLNGLFLNVTGSVYSLTDMSEAFLPDDSEESVNIDTLYFTSDSKTEDATSVYETFQSLIAKAHAGDLDFLVTGSDTVNQLIYNEFYLDLSGFLTPEQLDAYEGQLLYMDRAFLEDIRQLDASTDLAVSIKYPDPADPASMKDPVPVLIDIKQSPWIAELYPGDPGLYAFGLVTNGQHHDTALQFLDFLLKGGNEP